MPATPHADTPGAMRDYSFVADGQRGALIGPEGDVAWMCFPRWEDPAVFASLIGSGGTYSVCPDDRRVWGGYYEDRSLVWRSRWTTTQGFVESHDALAYPGSADQAVLLRRIHAIDAPCRVEVVLDPATDYGRRAFAKWHLEDGVWTASSGDVWLRWTGGAHAVVTRRRSGRRHLELTLELAAGDMHDLVLELATSAFEEPPPDPARCWDRTRTVWSARVPAFDAVVATQDVQRSYAVLCGLTPPGGGTLAAATTSLPERARAGRNYDYRYTWVRDLCYIGHATRTLSGATSMFDDAVCWVSARLLEDGSQLRPVYTSKGGTVPKEETLDLVGYPGGRDVVGNQARDQFQLDALGESLLLMASAAHDDRLDADGWRAAEVAAEAVATRWQEPDSGVWELTPNRWAHSALTCVGGLRAICRADAPAAWSARYLPLADQVLAEVSRTCVHPTGRWQRAPDDDRVDVSLLLAQVRGVIAPDDPRSVATRRAVASDLSRHGFVYRYRHHGPALQDAEGAFLIGNFWMSLACTRAGEVQSGIRWFERGRSAAGTTGLFSEEYDVEQRQLRGNVPQAFVHALMIEAATEQGLEATGWSELPNKADAVAMRNASPVAGGAGSGMPA